MSAERSVSSRPVPAFRVQFELLLAASDHESANKVASSLCGQLLAAPGVVSVEAWVDEKPQEFFDRDDFPELTVLGHCPHGCRV